MTTWTKRFGRTTSRRKRLYARTLWSHDAGGVEVVIRAAAVSGSGDNDWLKNDIPASIAGWVIQTALGSLAIGALRDSDPFRVKRGRTGNDYVSSPAAR